MPLEFNPFPHLVVTDCFPAEYYDRLVAAWPALDAFADLGNVGRLFGLYNRPYPGMQETLATRGLLRHQLEHRALWAEFFALVESAIVPVLFEKFRRAIHSLMRRPLALARPWRPRLAIEDLEVLSDMLIMRKDRHDLGAHVDDLRSLIQVLIYLPPDDDHPHLGTQLFEQVGPGTIKAPTALDDCRYAQYANAIGIEVREAKRVPFRRNTLLAAVNGPRSWHGQELNEPYERRGYQGFLGVRAPLLNMFFDRESAAALAAAS